MDGCAAYWDRVGRAREGHHLERRVAEYKGLEHVRLLEAWSGSRGLGAVLKTDAYEEAYGPDTFVPWLLARSGSVSVVDVSKTITAKARKAVRGADYSCADVTALPFRDGSFDLAVSNSTLDHLAESDVPAALSELNRVIKAGGVLVLTLDNAHNPLYRLGYHVGKSCGLVGHRQEKCYLEREVRPLLAEAGFSVSEVRSIVHLPTPFNLVAKTLSSISPGLSDPPLRMGIRFFSAFGMGGRNRHTGWFLAFRCVKD